MATKVLVNLSAGEAYGVRIGFGIMDELGRNLREVERFAHARDMLAITDENVAPLYLARMKESLAGAGFRVADVVVPAGEEAKSLEVASEIYSAMAQLGLGRDCGIVALGGGVVGDLAGFVASTYVRGVPIAQVPTTLLAMVDSSIGGKTAVNLPEGKNLVGTFHQPAFVCADLQVLATLPEREWRCGCGEVAKSAVIDSDEFFFWLCDHAGELAHRSDAAVFEAVKRCVVFKAGVVANDEVESIGVRECLNYGHTLGHAIESVSGYGAFSHGEAVAEGMRFAARIAQGLRIAAPDFVEAQAALLDDLGLSALEWRAPADKLLVCMKRDKKARGGAVRFVLASDVGRWQVLPVSDDALRAALSDWENAR